MRRHPSTKSAPVRKTWETVFLAVVVLGTLGGLAYMLIDSGIFTAYARERARARRLEDIPFDGATAYGYLNKICELGTRISGSPGMHAQQKLMSEHFTRLGGAVHLQEFRVRHPLTGDAVTMANLIVNWHPERKQRILMAAHYDTRPFPDRDRENPQGVFLGANDGASGAALLMELGRHMAELPGPVGVDFVLFDGEEFVFDDTHPYFLGSDYFSRSYISQRPAYRYRKAVVLDMIGDADLDIFQERNSASWRDTRPLVRDLWQTADRLGVQEFIARKKHDVRDDHIKLHDVAKIPACNVIDFDYPYWHTTGDTPDKCSALSLAKVGWVVLEWLKQEAAKAQ